MMVIYDPYAKPPYNKPWCRSAFVGCFGDRKEPGLSSWIVPGTWPEWML